MREREARGWEEGEEGREEGEGRKIGQKMEGGEKRKILRAPL